MSSAKILIVDDEPQIRRVMRTALTAQGYIVNDARSGEDALEKLRREKQDLVLLDLNMPGMGGLAACRQIRADWDIAIMVLLLAPLACLLSIGFNVLVSSRSNDVRASQQVGVLIMLPFGAVYLLSEFRVISLTTEGLLVMAAVLAVVDVVMFWIVKATFQREEILTRWK